MPLAFSFLINHILSAAQSDVASTGAQGEQPATAVELAFARSALHARQDDRKQKLQYSDFMLNLKKANAHL